MCKDSVLYCKACTRKEQALALPWKTSKEEPVFYSGQGTHQLLSIVKNFALPMALYMGKKMSSHRSSV